MGEVKKLIARNLFTKHVTILLPSEVCLLFQVSFILSWLLNGSGEKLAKKTDQNLKEIVPLIPIFENLTSAILMPRIQVKIRALFYLTGHKVKMEENTLLQTRS